MLVLMEIIQNESSLPAHFLYSQRNSQLSALVPCPTGRDTSYSWLSEIVSS